MYSDEPEEAAVTQETHTVTLPEYQTENIIAVKTLENMQNTEMEKAAKTKVTVSGITWQSAPAYDAQTFGEYVFTPVLPEGYALAEGVRLPEIRVIVQESFDQPIEDAAILSDTSDEMVSGLTIIVNYTVYDSDSAKALDYVKESTKYSDSIHKVLSVKNNWTKYTGIKEEPITGNNYATVKCRFEDVAGGTTWDSYSFQVETETDRTLRLTKYTSFAYDSAKKQITVDVIYYAVTFHGDTVTTTYVWSGERAKELAAPAKEGYLFIGWCKTADGREVFDFKTPITEITDLYPLWQAPHSHDGVSFDTVLTDAGGTLNGGSYYLSQDISLTQLLTIEGTVDLCLNGYTLTAASKRNVIKIKTGGTLNLYDCSGEKTGIIIGAESTYGGIWLAGNQNPENGSCTLNMYGGSIEGNTSPTSNGGGVTLIGNVGQKTVAAEHSRRILAELTAQNAARAAAQGAGTAAQGNTRPVAKTADTAQESREDGERPAERRTPHSNLSLQHQNHITGHGRNSATSI